MPLLSFDEVRRRSLRSNHAENVRIHYFSARASIYVTYLLAHTRLTANQVTHVFTLAGLTSAVAVSVPGFWSVLLAVAIFRLHILLDVVDGELARYRQTQNDLAAYQDYLTHYLVYPLFLFGAGWNARSGTEQVMPVVLAGLAGFGYVLGLAAKDAWYHVCFGESAKSEIDRSADQDVPHPSRASGKATIARVLMELTDFSGFLFFFVIAATVDEFGSLPTSDTAWPLRTIVLALFAVTFYLRAFLKIVLIAKMRRLPRRADFA